MDAKRGKLDKGTLRRPLGGPVLVQTRTQVARVLRLDSVGHLLAR